MKHLTEDFVLAPVENPLGDPVEVSNSQIVIKGKESIADALQDIADLSAVPLQLLVGSHAIGDVGRDPDDADQLPPIVVEGGVGDDGGELGPVPPPDLELARPGRAGTEPRHDLDCLLAERRGWDDAHDVLADDLIGSPSVEGFSRAIHIGDAAIEVCGDHCLADSIQQLGVEGDSVSSRCLSGAAAVSQFVLRHRVTPRFLTYGVHRQAGPGADAKA